MLPSIKGYLTWKLTDNLISQSSTGGKSSFCEPESAMLQVSVHASLKARIVIMWSENCSLIGRGDYLNCPVKGEPSQSLRIQREAGQYGCRSCVSIRSCQISQRKYVAFPPNFCEEYLSLHRTCCHVDSMKGPTNFLGKVRIIWESFLWFSYLVASMSDFHYNVSSRVFLFADGPTWNWLPTAKWIGGRISLPALKTKQRWKNMSLPFTTHWTLCLKSFQMEMSTLWEHALSWQFCHPRPELHWGIWRSQWTSRPWGYPTGLIMWRI